MPWALAAAAVGVGGSVASGVIGSDAASSAANRIAFGSGQAQQGERQALNQTTANLQPYVTGGGNAFADLQKLLGIGSAGGPTSPVLQMLGIGGPGGTGGTGNINPATFQSSPGYQYQLQQGTNAVTNSAAANGGLGGNALRALMGVGQQQANQGWQQYLGNTSNAWQQQIGNVAGVANTGYNATNSLGNFTTDTAKTIGGQQIGAQEALGAGDIASAKALQTMISGIVSSLTQGMGGMGGGGGSGGGGGGGGMSGIMSMFGGGGSNQLGPQGDY